jgi:hypothetical protein
MIKNRPAFDRGELPRSTARLFGTFNSQRRWRWLIAIPDEPDLWSGRCHGLINIYPKLQTLTKPKRYLRDPSLSLARLSGSLLA